MPQFTARFVEKKDSPSGLVSLVYFQPEETFTFLEGQFMMITYQDDARTLKKPYSISTTNRYLQETKRIGFIVKKTSEDGMSAHLTTQTDYTVTLQGPVGHYVDQGTSSQYLLISTGSGLSPNISLLEKIVHEATPATKIVFLFGEKHADNLLPSITDLLFSETQHLSTHVYLSQQPDCPKPFEVGHVQDGLDAAITSLGTNTTCFVCGQPAMVKNVVQRLQDLGVPKEYINREQY